MSAKERIITIRLMEKLQAYPAYAKGLGIEISVVYPSEGTDKKEK